MSQPHVKGGWESRRAFTLVWVPANKIRPELHFCLAPLIAFTSMYWSCSLFKHARHVQLESSYILFKGDCVPVCNELASPAVLFQSSVKDKPIESF